MKIKYLILGLALINTCFAADTIVANSLDFSNAAIHNIASIQGRTSAPLVISSQSNQNISIAPNGVGAILLTNPLQIAGQTYTFPTLAGGAGTVLTNNGSGTLTWTTNAGGNVTGPGSTNVNSIATWANTGGTALLNTPVSINASNGQMDTPGAIFFGSGLGNAAGQLASGVSYVALGTTTSGADIFLIPFSGRSVVAINAPFLVQDGFAYAVTTTGASNPSGGKATEVNGTITVTTSAADPTSLIFAQWDGTGTVTVPWKVIPGVGNFTIETTTGDTGEFSWFIVNQE